MGIKNGTALKVSYAGAVVDDLTSVSYSGSMEPRDATTKDSAANRELDSGKLSTSITAEGLYDPGSTTNFDVLESARVARAAVAVVYNSGAVATEYTYSVSAFVTQVSLTGGVEDNVTYSVTFEVTGAVTPALVT
jgi:hypothetical protein